MGALLNERRKQTEDRLARFNTELKTAATIARDKACVYATGSFARGEAGTHSDLDLFIVGRVDGDERTLRKLDEICLKAELIEMTRTLSIPDFSGDGEYLRHYTVDELVGSLGSSNDDATNTFTARLLLLLESRPLVGKKPTNLRSTRSSPLIGVITRITAQGLCQLSWLTMFYESGGLFV